MVLVVGVVTMEEMDQLTELRRSVVVEIIIFDYNNIFILRDYIYVYLHVIGGSSYIGGCNPAYPITYLPGVTGITSTRTETMPPQAP